MRKIKIFALLASVLLCMTSCLHYNLEELPAYSDAELMYVYGVQFRYYGDQVSPTNGEKIVQFAFLDISNIVADSENATYSFDLSTKYLQPELAAQVTLEKVAVIFQLSTAARCEPIDGAPAFGVPGDWTKPNQYKVTAADGTTKIWTVTINCLTR